MKTQLKCSVVLLLIMATCSTLQAQSPSKEVTFQMTTSLLYSNLDFVMKVERHSTETDIKQIEQVLKTLGIDANIEYKRNSSDEIDELKFSVGSTECSAINFGALLIMRHRNGDVTCAIRDQVRDE